MTETAMIIRPRTAAAPERAHRATAAAALAFTGAFAGGGLLTQTVIVPHWRALDPAAFLSHFASYGPATGATLFPIEVASVVLLAAATYLSRGRSGQTPWALATAAMVGTLLLLPIYFVGANLALLEPGFPPAAVAGELAAWYGWNWVRTGLGMAATVLCTVALATGFGRPAGQG